MTMRHSIADTGGSHWSGIPQTGWSAVVPVLGCLLAVASALMTLVAVM